MLAATGPEVAQAFVEIGLVAVGLSILARLASRLGITAVPFYLVAGLGFGAGGIADLGVSEEFVALGAEIGVLLLLFTLGLEYTGVELRAGLRTARIPGLIDAATNFTPGFIVGLILGWEPITAVLLGGVTWISSSGVIAKVLTDLDRLGYRETPSILNLLVIEDLAMAVYLPVVAAVAAGGDPGATVVSVVIALVGVAVVLWVAMSFGPAMSARLDGSSNEALLLAVFGVTLLISGLAQKLQISAAIGAFLVGLAMSGPVQHRVAALIEPLRDLFAAIFFLFFAFQIQPDQLPSAALPALALLVVTGIGKLFTGWKAAERAGASRRGRFRAGTTLIARGEFSIVIASLGAGLAGGAELSTVAAAYVLLTAVAGPLAAKYAEPIQSSLGRRLPALAPVRPV